MRAGTKGVVQVLVPKASYLIGSALIGERLCSSERISLANPSSPLMRRKSLVDSSSGFASSCSRPYWRIPGRDAHVDAATSVFLLLGQLPGRGETQLFEADFSQRSVSSYDVKSTGVLFVVCPGLCLSNPLLALDRDGGNFIVLCLYHGRLDGDPQDVTLM